MSENTQQSELTNGEYSVQIVGNDDIGRPIEGPIITDPTTNGSVPAKPISTINTTGVGRPTLYSAEAVSRLLTALSAGLTHKQACLACGISQSTLAEWRNRYPELESRMEAARETARQIALQGIKTAGEKEWRALAEWLRLTFPDLRQTSKVEVSATATANNPTVICTEEQRAELIAQREELLAASFQPRRLPASDSTTNADV